MAEAVKDDKTNFTFKMDKLTRKEFSTLCDTIGIPMSSAINALIKQAVREQKMNFSAADENGFSAEEAKELKRRIKEIESGKSSSHKLIEV